MESFDLAAKSVRIEGESTKIHKARTIALDGELLEAIQGQWDKRKVAEIPGLSPALIYQYVVHRNGKPVGDFRDTWDKALKVTGLAGKILYDFRRTTVRNMTRADVHERVAMTVSGHKTRSVFDRYVIVSEDDQREAARKVWEYARSGGEGCLVEIESIIGWHSLGTLSAHNSLMNLRSVGAMLVFFSYLWCPEPDSNRHSAFAPRDFKSLVSTYSTIRACFKSTT